MADSPPDTPLDSTIGTPPPAADDVFVVEYQGEFAALAYRRTSRAALVTSVFTTVVAVIVLACAGAIVATGATAATIVVCVLAAVVSLGLAVRAWRAGAATQRMARDIQDRHEAMRISATGVAFPDLQRGGWVQLPWDAIEAARILMVATSKVLVLDVDPDYRPDAAQSAGAAKPGLWEGLQQRTRGMPGPRFGLASLRETVGDIDAALRRYSGGRVSLS